MEQDDSMEKSIDVNDENTYVSHYPDSRRYSKAMATNRPQYCVDNQGYSVNTTQEADENLDCGSKETKIDIPSSNPPQYSVAVADKASLDKKVKVSATFLCFSIFLYNFYELSVFVRLMIREIWNY